MILALVACQSTELSQEWELDRLRLLAVRGDPAEPRPGETVAFSSLVYVPDDADWTAIWFACVVGDEEGCSVDPALLEDTELSFEDLVEAGFVGYEPGFPPSWTVPEDALDGLTEDEALEGLSATVQVTLATEDDTELALKYLPVSLATTPNHNPDIGSLTVDDVAVGGALVVDAGQTYALTATLADGLEAYEYKTTEGVVQQRTEEPEWRWYASLGTFGLGEVDLSPDPGPEDTVDWIAPDEPGEGVVHAVALDGRGGMAWWTLAIEVR